MPNDSNHTLSSSKSLATLTARGGLPANVRRGGGMAALNWLIDREDPEAFLGELATGELYFTMKEIGLGDSHILLDLATPEQIRGILDLDLWTGHDVKLERWIDWLDRARSHSIDTALKLVQSTEPELLQLLFTREITVHPGDLDIDLVPDELQVIPSPDGAFWVTIPRDHELTDRLHDMMKLLWAADMDKMRDIFQTARFDLPSSIEETLIRFRQGRLEEMGFFTPGEALSVYAYSPPKRLREEVRADLDAMTVAPPITHGEVLHDVILHHVTPPDTLGAVLGEMSPRERERFAKTFTYLVNKVFMARTGDLSQTDALPEIGGHCGALVNLGLLWLADESLPRALEVANSLWPEQLFRVGFSLVSGLSRQARQLAARSGAHHNLRLFGEPVDDALQGLSRPHPVLYEGLITPGALTWRDVRTLEELSRLEVALADAGSVLDFFEQQLGFSPEALMGASFGELPEAERDGITFATLFRTGLAQSMLSDTFTFQPLSREELAAFLSVAYDLNSGRITATSALNDVLAPLKAQVDELMAGWIDDQVDELGLALGRVQAYDLDPAFASALILTVGD
jgi:hypothetical protein